MRLSSPGVEEMDNRWLGERIDAVISPRRD
jgi:hypothetical protein